MNSYRRKTRIEAVSYWGKGAFQGLTEFRYGSEKPKAVTDRVFEGQRREQVVEVILTSLREYSLTKFEYEGACRAGLRAKLCLQGHPWRIAEHEAKTIVAEALRRLGAVRPVWEEGQPEFLISKENCVRCGGPLDEDDIERRVRFCSQMCRESAKLHRTEIFSFQEKKTYKHSFYIKAKKAAEERSCHACGKSFLSIKPDQAFCSNECRARTRINPARLRDCECCGERFLAKGAMNRLEKYCGIVCYETTRAKGFEKTCEHCKTSYRAKTPQGRFCSSVCNDRAKYERRKALKRRGNVIYLTPEVFDRWFAEAA